MKKRNRIFFICTALFVVLMSLPFLVPHCGPLALFGFVPLLCMERIAAQEKMKRFWLWHYGVFVLWNAATTFWVCHATVGGGIFAVLANALQMSLVFGLFRWVKKRLGGALPYIFLAAAWIAWERWYLVSADISWPWLVLGNAFARSLRLVQWYEVTGTLGGSLWVWMANLAVFGTMVKLSDGSWNRFNVKAKVAIVAGLVLVFTVPPAGSAVLWHRAAPAAEETLPVLILQPNIDPYQKFVAMTQEEQDALLIEQANLACKDSTPVLVLAPETFTNNISTAAVTENRSFHRYQAFVRSHPAAAFLFGASTYDLYSSSKKPTLTARGSPGRWYDAHNSAIVTDTSGRYEIFHKSKLVVGTEMTPYPRVFVPLDDWLSRQMGVSGLMARDLGQKEISLLHAHGIPIGCAVCYESVYGEYCTGYVRKGARMLTIITNDAWWGNTPGYRQHLSYASLRAIETRRDIARCGNTGISAFIDRRGTLVSESPWWQKTTLRGAVGLYDGETFFVRNGDITGRICVFLFVLLLAAAVVRRFKK